MIIQKVKSFISKHNLLQKNDRILVCVSGGPDSIFLLHVLFRLKSLYGLTLYVAHVNHNLRGSESDADEAFVLRLSQNFKLPFFRCKADVKKIAKHEKSSLEEAARKIRYNFFINICSMHNIDKIFLGHTKDDQVETIIMRLMRGTGMDGLCGMKSERTQDGVKLIRPLLEVEKCEILSYLKQHKIKSRVDSSNLKTDYFRNKVRLELIPGLIKYSPQIKENIFRLGENAKQVTEFLDAKIKAIYSRNVKILDGDTFRLNKQHFLKLLPALRYGLIRSIIKNLKGDLNGIDFKHIKIVSDFIGQDISTGKYLVLPKSIQVLKAREHIDFCNKSFTINKVFKSGHGFLIPGMELKIPEINLSFKATVFRGKASLKNHSKMVEYFDLDKLKLPLKIRTRKKGDMFHPLGAGGRKKLKKFLIDKKIESREKDSLALVISGKRIAWVVGLRIADTFKVSEKTKHILKIQARNLKA